MKVLAKVSQDPGVNRDRAFWVDEIAVSSGMNKHVLIEGSGFMSHSYSIPSESHVSDYILPFS